MSRIGKKIITIPAGVTVDVSAGNLVTVKGPKGTLSQQVDQDMIITIEEGVLTVARPTEQKRHKAMHGLYRSLINNMVVGVSEGYQKDVGNHRCWLQGRKSRKYFRIKLGLLSRDFHGDSYRSIYCDCNGER